MELRAIDIKPEHEQRLRELLKIQEAAVDALSDDELDRAEQDLSQRILHLVPNPHTIKITRAKSKSWLGLPAKTSAAAFLAAAAAMLFVQMNSSHDPMPKFVSKGTQPSVTIDCEAHLVELSADVGSYLKMSCRQQVFVHIGIKQGETLHLLQRNLTISASEGVVQSSAGLLNFRTLPLKHQSLFIVASEQSLESDDLSETEWANLWTESLQADLQK